MSPVAERAGRRAGTREVIVREAARLFALRGYEGASISEIAVATGISKPAIYHHFEDKDQIYSFIVVSVLRDMLANAGAALSTVAEPGDRLRAFMVAHADFFEQHRFAYIAAQLGFRGLRTPTVRDEAVGLRDDYEQILRDVLREGDRAGSLVVRDVPSTGRLILSSLNWMARWYQPGGPQTARAVAASYADIFLGGIGRQHP